MGYLDVYAIAVFGDVGWDAGAECVYNLDVADLGSRYYGCAKCINYLACIHLVGDCYGFAVDASEIWADCCGIVTWGGVDKCKPEIRCCDIW